MRVSGSSRDPVPPARTTPFTSAMLDPSALPGDLAEGAALGVRRALRQAGLRVRAAERRLHGLRRARSAEARGDLLVRRQVVERPAGEPRGAQGLHDLAL